MLTVLVCLVALWILHSTYEWIKRGNPTPQQYWDCAVHPQRKGY